MQRVVSNKEEKMEINPFNFGQRPPYHPYGKVRPYNSLKRRLSAAEAFKTITGEPNMTPEQALALWRCPPCILSTLSTKKEK